MCNKAEKNLEFECNVRRLLSSDESIINFEKEKEDHSEPINISVAVDFLNTYTRQKKLMAANGTNLQTVAFNFDADDLMRMMTSMDLMNDRIHVMLAYDLANNKHTIVLACSILNEDTGFHELQHSDDNYPWYEYSRPCPDACPKRHLIPGLDNV